MSEQTSRAAAPSVRRQIAITAKPAHRPIAIIVSALMLLATVLLPASPAFAHGADAPDATNYRSTITSVPRLAGLEVISIEAGARLQVTNHTGQTVEVLGYSGEPYLEIRPDGVYENIHSPATYLNITILHVDPPAGADPTVAPEWRKVSDEPMYRWHDQRALWTLREPPPEVAAAPEQPRRLREWTVPMRVDVTPLRITGVLDWVPPPSPMLWWSLAAAGIVLIALLGLITGRPRPVSVLMSVLIMAGAVLSLVYAVAREIDAGNHTVTAIGGQLFTVQLWPVVNAVAGLAAGIYCLARRADADFALALGGTAVALFSGMINAAIFHRAIAPIGWDGGLARAQVAMIMAFAGGSALAAMLRLRAIPVAGDMTHHLVESPAEIPAESPTESASPRDLHDPSQV